MKKCLALLLASSLFYGPFAQSAFANGRAVAAPTAANTVAVPALGFSAGSSAPLAPGAGLRGAGLSSALPSLQTVPIAPAHSKGDPLPSRGFSGVSVAGGYQADPLPSRGFSGVSVAVGYQADPLPSRGFSGVSVAGGYQADPLPSRGFSGVSVAGGYQADPLPLRGFSGVSVAVGYQGSLPGGPRSVSGREARSIRAGGELFDGSQTRQNAAPVPGESGTAPAKLTRSARLAAWGKNALLKLKPAKKILIRTEFDRDSYGGPPALKEKPRPADSSRAGRWSATFGRSVLYGVKQGINMLGIAAILDFVVKPFIQAIPWQNFVSDQVLSGTGRIELLTHFGPSAIAQAVAQSPLGFFFNDLVQAVFLEEVVYRVLYFGIGFLVLAAIRPLAKRAQGLLDELPELFGLKAAAKALVGAVGRISNRAYALAAGYSALIFGAAHFGAWGFHPYTFIFQAVLGLALVHTAYRSRGIVAPFFAHFVFNASLIAVGVLLPSIAAPSAAAAVSALVSLFSVAFLWYNIRAGGKDRAAARAEALEKLGLTVPKKRRWLRILSLGMMIPALAALVMSGSPSRSLTPAAAPALPPGTVLVDDKAPAPAAKAPLTLPAAATVKAPLTTEQLVKQSKAAVVMVKKENGSGTGFIISPDGLLVTNAHVVADGTRDGPGGSPKISRSHADFVMIRFANGRQVPGHVVGFNAEKDLALVQLPMNPFGWPSVPIGESGSLAEGQEVVAMGYPLGLPFSVSRGIVSGLGFRNNGSVNFVQHDASVNPGNSGGPLFNTAGEVVGVNSMIMSQSGGFDGISYSISAADLKAALAQYQKVGNISKGWLGAILYPGDPSAQFGARVDAVRPGSPAEKAGLKAGDVIIGIDGMALPSDPLQTTGALMHVLKTKIPTDTVELQVSRDGGVIGLKIVLEAQ